MDGRDFTPDEEEAAFADYLAENEPHYCDFPLCPCDANQNRLLAESRAYYAGEHEHERMMEPGYVPGYVARTDAELEARRRDSIMRYGRDVSGGNGR